MDKKEAYTRLLDLMQMGSYAKHYADADRIAMVRAEDEARYEEAHTKTVRTFKVMALVFMLAAASVAALVALGP